MSFDLKKFRIELHAFFFFVNTLFTLLLYFYTPWSYRRKVSQLDEENRKYFRFLSECIFTGEWPSTYVQIHHWYTLHYFFHYFLCEGRHSIFLLFMLEKWFLADYSYKLLRHINWKINNNLIKKIINLIGKKETTLIFSIISLKSDEFYFFNYFRSLHWNVINI